MRTTTIKRNDTNETLDISLRPLKRREIRELAPFGYTYLGCSPKFETAQDAVDKSLEMVLTKKEQKFLDECDARTIKDVWSELLKETYGDRDEEKNLLNTTAGTLTESE